MKTTLRLSCIALLLICLNPARAQNNTEIVEKGITVIKSYKQNVIDGEKEFFIDKIEFFDKNGALIEMKDFADNGKGIKEWIKYTYDADGNCIEEIEYDWKERVIKRRVTTYENGLKVLREFYDDKDRLTKKRKYEYEFSK